MRLLIFSLLLLVSPVFAFPGLLSLDGFLTNSSGSALNGSYSFVFTLYTVSSGGSALWTETQTLAVSSGKLNALLGSVSALDLPFDQDYYLGVKVGADSEMSPRYRVASSAYSYTARNLAPNATAADNFYVSGNAGIGAGLKFGDTASACDSSSRGTMKYVAGGSGMADGVYQCMKKASGNYSWTLIKGGGVSATGGTITEAGGYIIHTFASSGTFTVASGGVVDVLVVAGGGGGGTWSGGGGGGAGGLVYAAGLAVSEQSYVITVGAGGAGSSSSPVPGANGVNSSFATSIVAKGGGGGGSEGSRPGLAGGSGGGGDYNSASGGAGTSGQGNAGGVGGVGNPDYAGGGGGGAGAAGSNAPGSGNGGNGGAGLSYSISGSSAYYAGGGGGGSQNGNNPGTPGVGGAGGGGSGSAYSSGVNGVAGTANTGGGGGGGRSSGSGGNGGSGIVIIRYLT